MKTVPVVGVLGLGVVCAACGATGSSPQMKAEKELAEMKPGASAEQSMTGQEDEARDMVAMTEGQAVIKVRGAANSPTIATPVDATPDPDGENVFYLATSEGDDGVVGSLYRARGDGSDIKPLLIGAPLSSPMGVAIALDGETLFVADMTATGEGAILHGPSGGGSGSFAALTGTEGLAPRAVSVAEVDDREWVYFTGSTRDGEGAAVYRVASGSEAPEEVASGAPLVAPAGVVATRAGVVYTIDALADDGDAALLRIEDGAVTTVVGKLGVGFPAGLTLDMAEQVALVSGLSPQTGRDVVYVVDLQSGKLSEIDEPVSAFAEPAGLHRAHNANVFAWADSEANDTGTVFVLSL